MCEDSFVDIHSPDVCLDRRNHTRSVFYKLLKILQTIRNDHVDLIRLNQTFVKVGISERNRQELLNTIESGEDCDEESLCKFLKAVATCEPVEKVYAALQLAQYGEIGDLVIIWNYRRKIRNIWRVDLPFSSFVHRRYHNLKTMIDNNCLGENREQVLDKLSAGLKMRLSSAQTDSAHTEHLQKHLEEMVTIDIHRIQLCGPIKTKKRLEILHAMSAVNVDGLDQSFLRLTFNSKLAVTYAKMGDFENTDKHIRATNELCARLLPCFATILALNDVVYAYQELCFINRTQENLERATRWCEVGYHISDCSDEEMALQWKRIVILFQVMTYLHISHEFEVGDIRLVDDVAITIATALLDDIQTITKGIEIRRKMVFNLCKARLNENSDPLSAFLYAAEARNLSCGGCLRDTEKENIRTYFIFLQLKTQNVARPRVHKTFEDQDQDQAQKCYLQL